MVFRADTKESAIEAARLQADLSQEYRHVLKESDGYLVVSTFEKIKKFKDLEEVHFVDPDVPDVKPKAAADKEVFKPARRRRIGSLSA